MVRWFRRLEAWPAAVTEIGGRLEAKAFSSDLAADYASVYAGRRAAMVVDVVASNQRRYESVVKPLVEKFDSEYSGLLLSELASLEPENMLGLPEKRWSTIRGVARALVEYRELSDPGMIDDELVHSWAHAVEDVRFAHRLDPTVGSVSGIGPALFAYMRMRSGADAVKPDVRVMKALRSLGLPAPSDDPNAWILTAEALAVELDVPRIHIDQALWIED